MSQFFPHSNYAETQPASKAILTTHVLYRGFEMGTVLGTAYGPISYLLSSSVRARNARSILAATTRSVATGGLVGTAALLVALPLRMKGREDIEWRDRSWRLLENKGQIEVDNWALSGTALGLMSLAVTPSRRPIVRGWRLVVGRAGLGGNLGILGYMAFRHGYHRGAWKDDDLKSFFPIND